MTRFFYTLIIWSLFLINGNTQSEAISNSDFLAEASLSFENKAYGKAIDAYEKINVASESAELYHNLSLAYFYDGQLGKSILNMERAKRLQPMDRDIRKNLSLLYENVDSETQDLPPFFLKAWSNSISLLLKPWLWILIHLVFLFAGVTFLYLYLLKDYDLGGMHFYYIRGVIIGLFSLSFLSALLAYNAHLIKNNDSQAIVMEDDTPLRAGAEGNSVANSELPEGLKVSIEDEIGEFYKVRLGDYTDGWVNKSKLERVKVTDH